MLSGGDIVVLVRLLADDRDWTFRSLGAELEIDPAVLHRSVNRLQEAALLDEQRKPIRSNAEEFLIHALRYLAPAEPGAFGRGVATGWGAPPLSELLADSDEPGPVWPDPLGINRGPTLEPVAKDVPRLAQGNSDLGEWFALLDAIRIGRARERKLASDILRKRIWAEPEILA